MGKKSSIDREQRIKEFWKDPQIKALLRTPERAREIERLSALAQPLVRELIAAGYQIESLYQLSHLGRPWKTALPILQRWLPLMDEPAIKEEIVRALSVPWVGNTATAQLIDEFKKADPASSLAWAIGNALSIVSVDGFEKEVIQLALNRKYGQARQMIVLGLGRLRSWDAQEAAVELLNDEDVKLHAIQALGAMKSKRALFELEKLLTDKRAVIRKEARKAITKINR